uniref:Coat protein n=1 Tax=Adenium obesum virus X TaxID=3074438 RepID=A0AA51VJF8_9VIRU|nr:coat protein [Adenium obesum virus X]
MNPVPSSSQGSESQHMVAQSLRNLPTYSATERPYTPLSFQSILNRVMDTSDTDTASTVILSDLSDPTISPSLADLKRITYKTHSNSVASPETVKAIAKEWVENGVPADQVALAAWSLAIYCADNGSSDQTEFEGSISDLSVSYDTLARITKKHTTLRKFCSYYAKIVWNLLIERQSPPAGWAKWNYRKSEAFAAFDFFDAVTNPAALEPKEGLVRQPTQNELLAKGTNKMASLHEAAKQTLHTVSNYAGVTQGRLPRPTLPAIEAPEY